MFKLHPTFLKKRRRREFVVLLYDEFTALIDFLEDTEDILLLQTAREEDKGEPGIPLEEVKKRLGL